MMTGDPNETCCPPTPQVDAGEAAAVARDLKALADPARLHLLAVIGASPDGEACVCDLTAPVGLTQPTVSHHLRILVEAGLLERDRRGSWSYYSVVPGALDSVTGRLSRLLGTAAGTALVAG